MSRQRVTPRLIGRSMELDVLRGALADSADSGLAGIVVVAGETGIGKSRLVAELADHARGRGVAVYEGGCVPLAGQGLPYGPLLHALREPLEAEATAVPDGPGRLQPGLESLKTAAAASGSTQADVFDLLMRVLRRLATGSPVLLIVEDVQWADRSTLDFVLFLDRVLRGERVLLVVTHRTGGPFAAGIGPEWLAQLASSRRVDLLELSPLTDDEVLDQLRALCRSEPAPALVQRVTAVADGNPFFVEELTSHIATHAGDSVPRRLHDLLMFDLHRLSAPSQRLLQAAAVVGRPASQALLAAAAGLTTSASSIALRETLLHQAVVGRADADRYAFRHQLLGEVIYANLMPAELAALHAATAVALESLGGGAGGADDNAVAAEVAYHWRQAGDLPRALSALTVAARTAMAVCGYHEARSAYLEALELWPRVPPEQRPAGVDHVDLLDGAGEAARWIGELDAAVRWMRQASDEAATAGELMRHGVLLTRLGRCYWRAGQHGESLDAYRRARRALEGSNGPELAAVMAAEAGVLTHRGQYAKSRALAEQAVELARRLGARAEEGHALNILGLDLTMAGDAPAGLAALHAALDLAVADGVIEPIIRVYTNLSFVLNTIGEPGQAAEATREGFERVRSRGAPLAACMLLATNAIAALFRLGRWAEARELREQLPPAAELGGVALHAVVEIAQLDLASGDLARAAELADVVANGHDPTDHQICCQLAILTAELALWAGQPDRAASAVGRRLTPGASQEDHRLSAQLCWLAARAIADEAEHAGLRHAEAEAKRAELDAVRCIVDRCHADEPDTSDPQTAAWLALFGAESARAEGHADPEAWLAAVECWHKVGQPYPALYAGWRHAEALLAHRRRSPAAAVLGEVADGARRLGASLLLRKVLELARVAGIDLAKLDGSAPHPAGEQRVAANGVRLTSRELDVLRLLDQGLTYRQIGRALVIAEKTVSVHVTHIYEKLGVTNRSRATGQARRLGLLS